jgi:two-component system, chemotaxis family, chemotaxis protein CheY
MKFLVVEDDFFSRKLLNIQLSRYGQCDVAVNGKEAVQAVRNAFREGQPYDLICLDIAMPEMDGQEALRAIRELEKEVGHSGLDGVKIIMTTAFEDSKTIMTAFNSGCEAYLVKPINQAKLIAEMEKLGLMTHVVG